MKNHNFLTSIIRSGYIGFIIFVFIILLTFLFFSLSLLNYLPKRQFDKNSSLLSSSTMKTVSFSSNKILPYTQQSVYAKITNENIYIYSQPICSDFYKIFYIPRSYFVLLLDNANDAQNLFYKAKYLDTIGYIKKNEVQPVIGTPDLPFAQATFKVFSAHGLELRNSPNLLSEELIMVPFLADGLTFYGKISGETMIPGLGNVWYYCKYISKTNDYYYGYLYSGLCCDLSSIPENEESLSEFFGEVFPKETGTLPVDNEIKLSNELKIVIIICASLPCLFIIYLLFKPTKLIIDNGKNQKKKIKRLKKSDYYEYDD